MNWKEYVASIPLLKRRVVALIIGITIMGFAVNPLRFALFGNDPYTCMNLGYSNVTGLSVGTCMTIFNVVFLVWMFFCGRRYINIGTLIYLFYLGMASDFFYALLQPYFGGELDLMTRVLLMGGGIVISCFGVSFYMASNIGMGPYDAFSWIMQDNYGHKGKFFQFKYIRIGLDFSAAAIGFMLGSIVSIGTIITAFFTGPLVNFFINNVSRPLIYGRHSDIK